MTQSITILFLILALSCYLVQGFDIKRDIMLPQRLEKRGCEFSCRHQDKCDDDCSKQNTGEPTLGICRHGYCYCGFIAP
ncbi:hypothetical protein BD560DRAFT_395609 [Blakeslea trispora]|nr:hypothetical protein BD560DRAFT_395609 [Blakeslea trispora]